jgi:UDP-N-acetylmuramoyl-tripeptide--D-alanyl-D-alanine ligase
VHLDLADIAAATGGRLVGDPVTVDGAAIDSRLLQPGELFVPIVAERDGHDFVGAALAAGASAYLTAREPQGGSAVVVGDTTEALTALGTHVRAGITGPVIGVTGSVGKTSVKDLLSAILSRQLVTSASPKSHNNELGVPLTLVNAVDGVEAVVVEMGARGIGHIAHLCSIARPTVGVVTTVAAAHTELFGTVEDIARAKGELVEALPADGTAVLNADNPLVAAMRSRSVAEVVTFGIDGGDVQAAEVALDQELRASFRLRSPWGSDEVRLAVRGEHQVVNAVAAAAAALACGVDVDDVAAGLESAVLSPWRMHLERAPSGAMVLNDAYNANPTSTAAALRSLAHLHARRRVAVLGVMAELGDLHDDEHAAIGRLARELGVEIVAVGAPGYGGVDVDDIEGALRWLGPVGEGDAVLVKGSRVAGLERLADALLAQA